MAGGAAALVMLKSERNWDSTERDVSHERDREPAADGTDGLVGDACAGMEGELMITAVEKRQPPTEVEDLELLGRVGEALERVEDGRQDRLSGDVA